MGQERPTFVEVGPVQNLPDLPQLEPELPEEQDLLQSFEILVVVYSIPCVSRFRGSQEVYMVVMVQRAHTDPRQFRNLLDRVTHLADSVRSPGEPDR